MVKSSLPTLKTRTGASKLRVSGACVLALLVVGLLPIPVEWQITLTIGISWATAAVALDLWQGYLGQISFGHGVFVAVGAYTWTILRHNADAPVWLAILGTLLVAATVAAVSGAAIVQLNHFGAAIVTFFMAFILSAFLNSSIARDFTGGQVGMPVPPLEIFGLNLSEGRGLYFLALAFLAVVIVLTTHYANSSSGRALEMIRESPLVASLLGIRVKNAQFRAFVFSGTMASLGGIIIAQVLMYVTPDSFTPIHSVVLVAMVVVGGQRTIVGPVIGALGYQALSTAFQSQPALQALYSAAVFLLFVVLVPGGIASLRVWRKRMGLRMPPGIQEDSDLVKAASVLNAVPGQEDRLLPRDPEGRIALRADTLEVDFKGIRALQGASLQVQASDIHALIGPNGAGKTTLINVMSGIQASSSGTVELFGDPIGGVSPPRIREAGVSRTFQNPSLVETLSLIDNVRLGVYSGERRRLAMEVLLGTTSPAQDLEVTTRCEDALRLVGVPEVLWSCLAGEVSFAVRKLADLARSIVQSPTVLLLDEPTAGISEDEIILVERAIRNVRDMHGTTVVVVAHHVPFVRRIADQVTVLDAGTVLETGEPFTVTRSPKVLEAFIGRSEAGHEAGSRRKSVDVTDRADPSLPHSGLIVRGLRAGYGAASIVYGLDLVVRPSEVVALTGSNGAGKSTTLKALSGLVTRAAESIILDGRPLPSEPHQIARSGLIHVPEGRGVIASLTVLENLRLGALAVGKSTEHMEEVLSRFPKLRQLAKSQAGLLSGGEQQMLAIARGLLGEPKVLMIDELSLGLSPKAAQAALETVVEIAHAGPGVLLVDQSIGALSAVCDRIYVLKEGAAHLLDPDAESAEAISEVFF